MKWYAEQFLEPNDDFYFFVFYCILLRDGKHARYSQILKNWNKKKGKKKREEECTYFSLQCLIDNRLVQAYKESNIIYHQF